MSDVSDDDERCGLEFLMKNDEFGENKSIIKEEIDLGVFEIQRTYSKVREEKRIEKSPPQSENKGEKFLLQMQFLVSGLVLKVFFSNFS